jgi:hypothetical protein
VQLAGLMAPTAVLNVPGPHAAHVADDTATSYGEKVPATHWSHAAANDVPPVVLPYAPSPHATHTLARVMPAPLTE